jgi:ribosomal protein S18 acetylase RimI-like enzyme
MIEVRHMRANEASAVARLHAGTITEGFLNKLGLRFLACLYRGIQDDASSHVWIAEEGGDFVGFCAYAQNVGGLYKRVLRKRFLRLAFASLPSSLNPWVLKEVVDTLRYPAKQSAQQLPAAEILSIAVHAKVQGQGVGKQLLQEALSQAKADGETEIKVVAGASLAGANRFYLGCGFQKRCEIEQHGHALNVYTKSL